MIQYNENHRPCLVISFYEGERISQIQSVRMSLNIFGVENAVRLNHDV